MNYLLKIAFFIIITANLLSQEINLVESKSFGEFREANSFAIDQLKNIFVADIGNNTILKFSDSGKIVSSTGGYGWDNNSFDTPVDLAVSFDLNIYICDYNNHRLQRYDKNLNYISGISNKTNPPRKDNFGYPKSITLSREGEIFFIDSENIRIVKLDVFRNFVRDFGGMNSGAGNLSDPTRIRIDNNNNVYVIDNTNIVVFDVYGNYIRTYQNDLPIISLAFIDNTLILLEKEKIIFIDLKTGNKIIMTLAKIISNFSADVFVPKDIVADSNQLYLLCNHKIFIFKTLY